jgi:hypothetical protein
MNEATIAALEALYAELPTIQCQGLCWSACGPINMSEAERERIEARGVHIEPFSSVRAQAWNAGAQLHCAALDRWGRCTVYDVRPLICRVWGNGRGDLACQYGCERTGPRLSLAEVMRLLVRSMTIGGGQEFDLEDERVLEDPQVMRLLIQFTSSGSEAIAEQLVAAALRARQRLEAR